MRRALLFTIALFVSASFGGELRVFSTDAGRIGLAPTVDSSGRMPVEAARADELLAQSFGGEMALVYVVEVAEEPRSEVWGPERRARAFAPYLAPAAERGSSAVLFLILEADGSSLYLLGVNGEVFEERRFTGAYADVIPLVTAAAVEGFHRRFPHPVEEPVGRGRLMVRCDGRGFSAVVDGNPVGVVPAKGLELWLSAGTHRLALLDGEAGPLETRFVNVVAAGLTVEEFFFGYDAEPQEEEDGTGEAVASCLFDVLFAVFCPPPESGGGGGSSGDGGGVWGPSTDDDDDDEDEDNDGGRVWGPAPKENDDEEEEGGGGVWGPNP